MNTATITSLTPDGRPPYQSAHGPLYGFKIVFDNNTSGLVNAKSETPAYKVGMLVGYECTGKVGQMDKLKITMNPDRGNQEPAKWTAPAAAPVTLPRTGGVPTTAGYAPREAAPALPPGTDFDAKMRAQALLYVESVQMAHFVSDRLDSMGNGKLSQEHFQGCASSIYIQANKNGLRVPQSAPKPLQVAGNGQGGGPATHPDLEPLPF